MGFDAILVLGGGLRGPASFPPWAKRRLDKAVELFSGKEFVIVLSAGTTHKPPFIDRKGFPVYESNAGADYLIRKGIPAKNVLRENASWDTIGNAYFARVIHTGPMELRRLAVITSSFHMERSRLVFEWVFSLEPAKPRYSLHFFEASDNGLGKGLIEARRRREKKSLEIVVPLAKKIRSLKAFHRWLFSKHGAYAAGLKPKSAKGKQAESY